MRPLNCYWWDFPNAGDLLTPVICQLFSRHAVLRRTGEAGPRTFLVGSIGAATLPGDVVLGTGRLVPGNTSDVDIRLGRGPLSFPSAPAYGDAALVLGKFFRRVASPKHAVVVIPHHLTHPIRVRTAWKVLPTSTPPLEFIQAIADSAAVLSESLHGCVIADALGVPNSRVGFTPRCDKDRAKWEFKFSDYYLGINHDIAPEFKSLHAALENVKSRALDSKISEVYDIIAQALK